jgi:hypothetical protein
MTSARDTASSSMKPIAIGEVHFDKSFPFQRSRHYTSLLPLLRTKRPEFAIYHECFERLVCETLIARGELTTLELLPSNPDDEALSARRFLVGFNNHSPLRVRQSRELFARFEADEADFIAKKRYLSTEYAQYFLAHEVERLADARKNVPRWGLSLLARRNLHGKVGRFINIFSNVKKAGRLVGAADRPQPVATLRHYDVPWAIKYGDYYRLRDGAHRRSVYAYLGEAAVPTLVVDFDRIAAEHLQPFPEYLYEHFKWYKEVIASVRD